MELQLRRSLSLSLTPNFSWVLRTHAPANGNRFNGFPDAMSTHSYSRCWLHLIWGTLQREGMFTPPQAARVSAFLTDYAAKNGIYMKANFVNTEHVHALVDLPTGMTIEQVVKLLKGASSHWINEQDMLNGKFAWGRGYGAFSVSQSGVGEVCAYIAGQAEHHRGKSFVEEYKRLVKVYGLKWRDEETVETVSNDSLPPSNPSLKRGVNEISLRNAGQKYAQTET